MTERIWHLNSCIQCSNPARRVSMDVVGEETYCKECKTYFRVSYRTKEEDK